MKRLSLNRPPTLEEYREWAKTARRNLTDDPIGDSTAGRREACYRSSQIVATIPRTKEAAA